MGKSTASITKRVFLDASICRTRGWFTCNGVAEPPTFGERLRMEEGIEIGRRARTLFPNGRLIVAADTTAAVQQTAQAMADSAVSAIFEATFHVGGYTVKADILQRKGKGWNLIEVKSSTNDDDGLVDDLTYTATVMELSSFHVIKASLLLISKDYRLGMEDSQLFVEVDHTEDVKNHIDDFKSIWDDVRTKIVGTKQPKPSLIFECRNCGYFEDKCLGKDVVDHIFDLPRLSDKKFKGLTTAGVFSIPDIPHDFELTEPQERVRRCVVSRKPHIGETLTGALAAVIWPAYYLDFESVMTAMPLYPEVAPYEQILTQYSVHICSGPGKVAAHHEYLANPAHDCRRELAERLLDALKGKGSIVVFSSFEKTRLNALAAQFPDLSGQLQACIDRLYDIEAVLRNGYCHPEFRGRTSIKRTLPVLVPDMSYEDLEIGDGDTAVAMFARMAKGRCSPKEAVSIRRNLLNYCKQDTLAMVKLHEQLLRLT